MSLTEPWAIYPESYGYGDKGPTEKKKYYLKGKEGKNSIKKEKQLSTVVQDFNTSKRRQREADY